jgi:hypothetical protein
MLIPPDMLLLEMLPASLARPCSHLLSCTVIHLPLLVIFAHSNLLVYD